MQEESEEKRRLNKEINKQQELKKERIEIAKKIIENLKEQKKIENEHLDLVGNIKNIGIKN